MSWMFRPANFIKRHTQNFVLAGQKLSQVDMSKKQKFPYLVGSRWTSRQTTWGWRHFQVVNRKNEGRWVFAEMVAACDPTVRFWLNAQQLKDRALWQPGWQTLQEQSLAESFAEQGAE